MDKISTSKIQSDLKPLCVALLLIALALSGCGKPTLEPEEIGRDDMCAFCKMAISERQYAAQFLNQDGDAFKFDDIGCMVGQLKTMAGGADVAAMYVTDYYSRQWVKADQAYFVQSEELSTPMGSNIIAFGDRSKAEEAVAKYRGRLLGFDEIFGVETLSKATSAAAR